MDRMIAGLYRIEKEIGSGGGGIVYLGKHVRLDKTIVLKADRRTLKAGMEALRREVDMLKELSNSYIPHVFDFIEEDGVVYTVMDFIDGESLDRPLERKEKLSQPDIIRWACQLLEALNYLHTRPPYGILHADIKPANIMLRPNGDICLIDFNIALALGEDGAVKVGFSRGYASPEHYGAEYVRGQRRADGYSSTGLSAMKTGMNRDKGSQGSENKSENQDDGSAGAWPYNAEDKTLVLDSSEDATVALHDENQGQPVGDAADSLSMGPEKAGNQTVKFSEFASANGKPGSGSFGSRGGSDGSHGSGSSTSSGKSVTLDVRSDIYSLGATLYHLISGRRPEMNAVDVIPLGAADCSPAVAAIINKAMLPSREDRWQSAEEMLQAFLGLYNNDPRSVSRRRSIRFTAAALGILFLTGGGLVFSGQRMMEEAQREIAQHESERADTESERADTESERADIESERADTEASLKRMEASLKLSGESEKALAGGNRSLAVAKALEASDAVEDLSVVPAEARKALADALNVYDLSDSFHALDLLDIPSEPFNIFVSPQGTRFAATYANEGSRYELAVYDAESLGQLVVLPTQVSALCDVVFLDEDRLIYAGDNGTTCWSLSEGRALWTGKAATMISLSYDGSVAAAVDRDNGVFQVYDAQTGELRREIAFSEAFYEGEGEGTGDGEWHLPVAANDIFANPLDFLFCLNGDGSRLAASFGNGGLCVYNLLNPSDSIILLDESDYHSFTGGFQGKYFAFAANSDAGSLVYVFNLDGMYDLVSYESQDPALAKVNEDGIYIANGGTLVRVDTEGEQEIGLAYLQDHSITGFSVSDGYAMVTADDGSLRFFDSGANSSDPIVGEYPFDFALLRGGLAIAADRSTPSLRLLRLENHEEAEILSYDAGYEHDEARLSKDRNHVMLFNIYGFRIYGMDGTLEAEGEIPDSSHIYDQQFRREEESSYLEVFWYDGTIRHYDAASGELVYEGSGDPPSRDLYEEFFTEKYRFASELHAAPVVYERDTGKEVARLQEDMFLTYVTEIPGGFITNYITAAGDSFGLLLNENLETLAVLSDMCDYLDGDVIYDYKSGNLRKGRIYSFEELLRMGRERITGS